MIKVINYSNKEYEQPFEKVISNSYEEVRVILPKLPERIQIYFKDSGIIKELGVGGFAYSDSIISIALDSHFKDKELQKSELRSMIFHESLHIYQHYTGTGVSYTPLEGAVYEGMATVFEKVYAGKLQPYGDYSGATIRELKNWTNLLGVMTTKDYENNKTYEKWKFYHPRLKQRWIAYKVGTWIVDEVLEKYKLEVIDLVGLTAKQILEKYVSIDFYRKK